MLSYAAEQSSSLRRSKGLKRDRCCSHPFEALNVALRLAGCLLPDPIYGVLRHPRSLIELVVLEHTVLH